MKPEDAEAIGVFVAEMIRAANNETGQTFDCLIDGLKQHFGGTPGSGACICSFSPEAQEAWANQQGFLSWLDRAKTERHTGVATIDHRCPKHGEKAQPALWGRHKEKCLDVTAAQWASLGVIYK